jgi:hypothetical protein
MHGDFDPAFITDQLRIEPARTHRRGELLLGIGRPFRTDYWVWKSEKRVNADSDDIAVEVLDRLEPTVSIFLSLKEQHSIQASLEIVPTMHVVLDHDDDGDLGVLATTPAHVFSAKTLARIGAYGLDLDIDEYVFLADSESHARLKAWKETRATAKDQ